MVTANIITLCKSFFKITTKIEICTGGLIQECFKKHQLLIEYVRLKTPNNREKVDSVLCSGLDYVESKVPSVKLPPGEILLQMYNNTKEYLTPAVETARFYAEPAYKTAMETVEKTKEMVEPLVQAALEEAQAIKDNIMHKVDEYLHKGHECAVGDVETCEECKNVREQLEKKKEQSNNPEGEQQ